MAREIERWTEAEFSQKKATIGEHHDGGGLYLIVRENSSYWKFRYGKGGKKSLPLGAVHTVTLKDARKEAQQARTLLVQGKDPRAEREAERMATRLAAAKAITFTEVVDKVFAAKRPGWRSAKHANEWRQTLRVYAEPVLGRLPVSDVDTALILKVLEPLWRTRTVTGGRLRQRVEDVLDYAKTHEWRTGDNPARWKGHLENVLARVRDIAPVRHHKALPFGDVPVFMAQLRQIKSVAADCLEFLILCGVRTSEAREATWDEITGNIWTIGKERTKPGREHRVALSEAALKVLARRREQSPTGYVFPGRDGAIGDTALGELMTKLRPGHTVHGLRSSFSDWAGETTSFPERWTEAALGHKLGSETEVAYRRGDYLAHRAKLMDAWARYCNGETANNITPLAMPLVA